MAILSKHTLILIAFLSLVSSTFSWGPCPSVFRSLETIDSLKSKGFIYSKSILEPKSYLGVWYDIYRNSDFVFAKGNCTQAYYYVNQEGKIIAKQSDKVNGLNISADAEVVIDSTVHGQLYVKFSKFAPYGDYKIVHTDYENTALVFSCRSVFIAHWKWAWILVRDPRIKPPEFYYRFIEDYGIPLNKMLNTSHQECLVS